MCPHEHEYLMLKRGGKADPSHTQSRKEKRQKKNKIKEKRNKNHNLYSQRVCSSKFLFGS